MNIEVYFGSADEIKKYLDKRPYGDGFDLDYIILDKQFTVKSRKLEQLLEKQRYDLAINQIRNLYSLNFEYSLTAVSKKKEVSEKNINLYYDLVYYEEHKKNDEFKNYLKNNSFNFEEIQNKTRDDIILDTKWAIILWCHSKFKKPQKHMYLVFDQIDCYFGKETLNSLLKIIREIIEKFIQKNIKLTIIFASHSLKHEYFFEGIKADIKKGSCIYDECQHGYVKLFLGNRLSNSYLFENIYLDKIPMFVVITGKNAVGKTLLLKTIKKYYENSLLINLQYNFQDQANTEGMKINIKESIRQIELYKNEEKNQKNHIYDSILEKLNEFRKEIKYTNFSDSFLLRKAYLNVFPLSICIKSFIEILTFALMIADPDDLNEYLEKKFFKYGIKIQENFIGDLIEDINIDMNVFFFEKSNTSQTKLLHFNLSAGEKISLYIYLWEYLYQKNYDLATNFKCILIDEPDSHLHPTKCKELIQFIEEKLIKEMNFQVFNSSSSNSFVYK